MLGTIGLVVAASGQPTLAEVVDRSRHLPEHHDDTEAEGPWSVPVTGPVDMSDFVVGPVSVSVVSAGNVHSGGLSAGTLAVSVRELGKIGEMFHVTEIELGLLTDGVTFTGIPVITSAIPCGGRVSSDGRAVTITDRSRGRRVPWTVGVSGLSLAADRQLIGGLVIRLEVAIRGQRRLTRRVPAYSPGTVVE